MRKVDPDVDAINSEACPKSKDDSGLRSNIYLAHFDLLCPVVIVSLLVSICAGIVTRGHFLPPCQSCGILF